MNSCRPILLTFISKPLLNYTYTIYKTRKVNCRPITYTCSEAVAYKTSHTLYIDKPSPYQHDTRNWDIPLRIPVMLEYSGL